MGRHACLSGIPATSDRAAYAGGMAIVAVLWIMAALISAAVALTAWVRDRAAQRFQETATVHATAVAQAALLQLLAHPSAQADGPIRRWRVTIGKDEVLIQRTSAHGAVDLNHAPADLIQAVLRHAGGLDAGEAQRWAQAIVDIRQRAAAQSRPAFQSVQDLLQRPGLPLHLWLQVEYALTVDSGDAAVDPYAASPAVLLCLAQGDAARAAQWALAQSNAAPMDTTAIPAQWLRQGSSNRWVWTARVAMGEGQELQLSWLVERAGAPWPWRLLKQTTRVAQPQPDAPTPT